MIMSFTDRFNRKHLADLKYQFYKIAYEEIKNREFLNRHKLPSLILLSGIISWRDLHKGEHCCSGPAVTKINGEMTFSLMGKKVSKLEMEMYEE